MPAHASTEAAQISKLQQDGSGGAIPHFVRLDFAYATRTVLFAMAAVMAAAAVVAIVGLRRGIQTDATAG